MIQDLKEGRLNNCYTGKKPAAHDKIICFQENQVLIQRTEDGRLQLPSFHTFTDWKNWRSWRQWSGQNCFQYVFQIQDTGYFIWFGEAGKPPWPSYSYETVRTLRQLISKDVCFAVMTAYHLYIWYRDNRFCGRCGTAVIRDDRERMLRCPECRNMIFPKIAPAVIIAVTDGNRILMSKYANREYRKYTLLAGFTEIGETAEDTVRREVMEEVGLRVKNIRYYKSQPWGVDSNLLLGFFCELDGPDSIHMDRKELAMAEWYERSALPAHDDGISLTREMIRVFEEGKEQNIEKMV